MAHIEDTRGRNRKALAIFIAVLLGVILLVEGMVYLQQRQYLLKQNREELRTEMTLLGELAKDALLRSDYAVVEDLVKRWLDRHDYLIRITAVMPNGFVLVDAGRARPVVEPQAVEQDIAFERRTLLKLRAIADFSVQEGGFSMILLQGSIVVVSLVLILGWILWWALQRTAIRPLEVEIGRREEKERELLQRTIDLETAINELETFSYSVSHDLRAPLRAIDGYGHALAEDYGHVMDQTAMDYISRSRAAAQRMSVVIDGLLGLSRISRHRLSVVEVDLSRLVAGSLARLAEADPHRRVETHVAAGVLAWSDTALIDIALDNLLRNAWKFTAKQAQARIEFGTLRQDGETVYFVKDNGAGFDMRYAGKLFNAFQRLHTPDEFAGSGIGLAIVSRIIRQHAGRIWADAGTGQGATFFFTLGTTSVA